MLVNKGTSDGFVLYDHVIVYTSSPIDSNGRLFGQDCVIGVPVVVVSMSMLSLHDWQSGNHFHVNVIITHIISVLTNFPLWLSS